MSDHIRLGMLRLSDAAPVVVAGALGYFEAEGIQAEIIVEPSWANIADKLGYGLLDGAVMLPPLTIACAMGLRGRKTDLIVPMSLSANGNAVVLAGGLRAAFSGGIRSVAALRRLRLGVVHGYSTHDLLLRYWLADQGVDPETAVDITVLPPAEMVGALAAGAIDGFCAGAPWGRVAEHAGLGFTAITTRQIRPDHPEKCLAVRADVAARDPALLRRLLRALKAAASFCANPEQRSALADLLARPAFLDLPVAVIAPSLAPEAGGPVFDRLTPDPEDGAWFGGQMQRWGKAPHGTADMARALYRPDIFNDD